MVFQTLSACTLANNSQMTMKESCHDNSIIRRRSFLFMVASLLYFYAMHTCIVVENMLHTCGNMVYIVHQWQEYMCILNQPSVTYAVCFCIHLMTRVMNELPTFYLLLNHRIKKWAWLINICNIDNLKIPLSPSSYLVNFSPDPGGFCSTFAYLAFLGKTSTFVVCIHILNISRRFARVYLKPLGPMLC